MTSAEIKQIFIDVVAKAVGSKREINDGGSEQGSIFTLGQSEVDGVASNLATWWEEATDADPTPEAAEDYLDETYPCTGETMKIQISAQHLTGNDVEGLNLMAWLEALEAEYRTLALQEFPQAEVEVSIDVQRASGYCRPVAVYVDDADGVDTSHLEFLVDRAANDLWEKRSQEFYEEEDPDLLSSLNLGPGEETTEEMLAEFRQELRSHCPRCGLPIHPEQELEAGLCPGCGARHALV